METWTIQYRETTDPDRRVVATIPDGSKEEALDRACEMMKPKYKAHVLRIIGPKGVEIPRAAIDAYCRSLIEPADKG